jgi:uncharacterized membrane protein
MIDKPNALASALDFNSDDLQVNRSGMISERQRARLRASRSRAALLSVLALVVIGLVAAGVLFLAQQGKSWIALLIGIALTVVNALIMGRMVQNWLRTAGDLQRAEVQTLSGVVTRTVRVIGRAVIYVLAIDGRELIIPKEVFNAIADGSRWRLYRAAQTGTLLAGEPI